MTSPFQGYRSRSYLRLELVEAIEELNFYSNVKVGGKKLARKMLEQGGKIIDNKFIGKIAYAQAISGDIKNSLNTIKEMEIGFDLSQTLINIANQINPQREDRLI